MGRAVGKVNQKKKNTETERKRERMSESESNKRWHMDSVMGSLRNTGRQS